MTTARTPAKTDRELAKIQLSTVAEEALGAPVEGKVVGQKEYDHVELKGEKFRIAEEIGAMPMLKWAAAAELSTDDPRALGAIYAMLKDCILEEDWPAFEQHALTTKADAEALLDVVTGSLEVISGRPTKQS
jgi:hypothetical protein